MGPERVTRLALLDTSFRADAPDGAAVRRILDKAARSPGRFHGFGDRLLATYIDPAHLTVDRIVTRIRAIDPDPGSSPSLVDWVGGRDAGR